MDIPVIFMSGRRDVLKEENHFGYLCKPFNRDELVKAVQEVLTQNGQQ